MLEGFIVQNNLAKFRLKQFNKAYYQDLITDFSEISTWPKDLREKAAAEIDLAPLTLEKELVSAKKDTIKVLFKRKKDGQRIETVLMRHKDGRNTVCISCMVGCPVNCSFCATGKMGFGGNLDANEIIEQVMYFQRMLVKKKTKVSNVVFMGMGEPMLNLAEVEKAISAFTDEDKLALSKRRITISTSGYVPQFKKLIQDGFRGRVAISLHAPNQELRQKMMPVAKIYPLDQLIAVLDEYVELTNKRVSYEYIMIKGLNDKEDHARQLVELFANRLAHINLIPYNPIRGESFERSKRDQTEYFKSILEDHGISVSIRYTMGDDIDAACGQLADDENQKHKAKKIFAGK
jgi:23S rRNA (adenine2503-C2)-methyltransferase